MTNDRSSKVFDGGVESRHASTGNKPGAVPGEDKRSSASSFARGIGPEDKTLKPRAGVTPGPSDPSPGPAPIADSSEAGRSGVDLEKRVADLMWAIGAKDKQILELSAALSAPVGEPVAWLMIGEKASADYPGTNLTVHEIVARLWRSAGAEVVPLGLLSAAPAVGPDMREAIIRAMCSADGLDYEQEVRMAGLGHAPSQAFVDDWDRYADAILSALTRPLGGFVQEETPLRKQELPGASCSASELNAAQTEIGLLREKLSDALAGGLPHWSSCAVYNAPAYEPEPCNCGVGANNGWRCDMENAPKEDPNRPGCMYEIMIAGGTAEDSMSMAGEWKFNGWTLACWDKHGGDDGMGGWRGENSGGHDEYYWHKPTHWRLKLEPPAVAETDADAQRDDGLLSGGAE